MTIQQNTSHPAPVLEPGVLYSGHQDLVCGLCAGFTARYTGVDITGFRIRRITPLDVSEWNRTRLEAPQLPPMGCSCGAVVYLSPDQVPLLGSHV